MHFTADMMDPFRVNSIVWDGGNELLSVVAENERSFAAVAGLALLTTACSSSSSSFVFVIGRVNAN